MLAVTVLPLVSVRRSRRTRDLDFASAWGPCIAGHPQACILRASRGTEPHLPMRQKSVWKDEIASPPEVARHAPQAQRRATDRNESQQTCAQHRDTAVFSLPSYHHGAMSEASLHHHKIDYLPNIRSHPPSGRRRVSPFPRFPRTFGPRCARARDGCSAGLGFRRNTRAHVAQSGSRMTRGTSGGTPGVPRGMRFRPLTRYCYWF